MQVEKAIGKCYVSLIVHIGRRRIMGLQWSPIGPKQMCEKLANRKLYYGGHRRRSTDVERPQEHNVGCAQ